MNDVSSTTALTAVTASEYDFNALLDASASMGLASIRFPGKTRWDEAQESILGTCRSLDKLDADGIDVVVFGPGVTVQEGVHADAVAELFASRGPRGSTPLHDALQVVIDKYNRTGKKQVAFVFTDGEPDDANRVINVINTASNSLKTGDELMFIFVQIGDDRNARAYLDKLDDNLSGKFDIVAVASIADADNFEPLDLINRALVTRAI